MSIILGDIISAIVGTADIIASNAVKCYRYCQGPRLIMLRMLQHQPHWKLNPKWEFRFRQEVCLQPIIERKDCVSEEWLLKLLKFHPTEDAVVCWQQLDILFSCYLIIYLYPSIYLSFAFSAFLLFFSLYSAQDYNMRDTKFLLVPLGHLSSHSFSCQLRGYEKAEIVVYVSPLSFWALYYCFLIWQWPCWTWLACHHRALQRSNHEEPGIHAFWCNLVV